MIDCRSAKTPRPASPIHLVPEPFSSTSTISCRLISQLAGPPFAEFVGKAAIVPERFVARLAETGPDVFADIGLSQIAKDCAGIMDLVRERDAQNVFIGGVEMRQIGLFSLLPVRLSLAFGGVGKAVRARRHNSGDAIAEPVADILQPRLAALILHAIVQQGGDRKVLIAAILENGGRDGKEMRNIGR